LISFKNIEERYQDTNFQWDKNSVYCYILSGVASAEIIEKKINNSVPFEIKKDYNYNLKKLKLELDMMIEQYLTTKNNYTVLQMKHKKAELQLDKAKMNFKNGVIAKDEIKRKEIIFKESIITLEEARDKILIEKLRIIQYIGLY